MEIGRAPGNHSLPAFDQLEVVEKNQKKILGTGGYACVRLVRDPHSHRLFALKEVDKE